MLMAFLFPNKAHNNDLQQANNRSSKPMKHSTPGGFKRRTKSVEVKLHFG